MSNQIKNGWKNKIGFKGKQNTLHTSTNIMRDYNNTSNNDDNNV